MKKHFLLTVIINLFLIQFSHSQSGWILSNTTAATQNLYSIDFGSSSIGFAAGNGGQIITTTTSGTFWNSQNSSVTNNLYSIDAVSATVVYSCGSNGKIIKTTNGGSTWSSQTSPTSRGLHSIRFLTSLYGFAVGDTGTIIKTINGGTSWSVLTSGTTSDLSSIQMTSSLTGFICGTNGTLLKTTDGGTTWSIQTSNTTVNLHQVLFTDSLNGYACGDNGKLIKTSNGGLLWNTIVTPYSPNFFALFHPAVNTILITGDNDWSVISYDNGATWRIFYGGAGTIYSIAACSSSLYFSVGTNGKVFKRDLSNCAEFNNQPTSLGSFVDLFFTDSITGYAVGGNSIYRTVDGLHWTTTITVSGVNFYSIHFPTPSVGYSCSYSNGAIYKTTDSGNSWHPVSSPNANPGTSIWFLNADTGYYANGHIWKTLNGGITWTDVFTNTYGNHTKVFGTCRDTIFAMAAGANLFRSTDGGQTWKPNLFPNFASNYTAIHFPNSNVGYLAMAESSYYTIFKTIDGGENWLPVMENFNGGDIYSLFFTSSDVGYASGRTTSGVAIIFKTSDGGRTWGGLSYPPNNIEQINCTFFPDARHGYFGRLSSAQNLPLYVNVNSNPTIINTQPTHTEASILSPPPSWVWVDGSVGGSSAKSVTDRHGKSIVIGYGSNSPSCPTASGFGYIAKYDSSGTQSWIENICSTSALVLTGVATDTAGNVYVIGSFTGTITAGNFSLNTSSSTDYDAFIAKLNSAGVPVWLKQINATGEQRGWSIVVSKNQEIIVTGCSGTTVTTFGSLTLTTPFVWPYWVAKYSSAGVPIWVNYVGNVGSDGSSAPQPLTVDSLGNPIVSNNYQVIIWGNDTLTHYYASGFCVDIAFAKLNGLNGNMIWSKTVVGHEGKYAHAIATDRFNNIYLAGRIQASAKIDSTWKSAVWNDDAFLSKFDPNGNLVWARTEGSLGKEVITAITAGFDGNLYFAGHLDTKSNWSDTLITSGTYGAFFVASANGNGNLRWIISNGPYTGPLGDSHWFVYASGIGIDDDTNVYVSSRYNGSGSILTSFVSGALLGKLRQPLSIYSGTAISENPQVDKSNPFLKIFPNPGDGEFTLYYNTTKNEAVTIRLIDITGRVIYTQSTTASSGENLFPLDIRNIAKGIYIVQVNGNQSLNGKLIMQ